MDSNYFVGFDRLVLFSRQFEVQKLRLEKNLKILKSKMVAATCHSARLVPRLFYKWRVITNL